MHRKHGREKRRLMMMYAGGASFVLLLAAFLGSIMIKESAAGALDAVSALIITIPFIGIVAFMIMFLNRQRNAVNSGLPLRDERTEKADNRSGRYTTMATTYFLLALMWYQFLTEDLGYPQIEARHLIYLILFFVLISFTAFKMYFGRKGDI